MFTDENRTPEAKRNDKARQEVMSAVNRLVVAEDPNAYEERELYPGAGDLWRGRHPLPANHLQAALALRGAVLVEVRTALDNARGAGMTWEEVGRLLGLEKSAERANMTLTLAAWRYAAMSGVMPDQRDPEWAWRSYGRGPTADWRCRTCTGHVHEGHPDNGVQDAEEGHKPGCTRHAAEVAAQERTWED